jgi:hypothetical protein
MIVRRWPYRTRRGLALVVCAAMPLVSAATADAQEPPAPGNLVANWGFDVNTAGWGSFGGTVARTENGSQCTTTIPGAATVTRQTGDVYTLSDSQGGNQPTVRSTLAGDTYIAYATVIGTAASAAGKPGRIILRERIGATGTIVKETAAPFTLPPVGDSTVVAVSTPIVRTGTTLGLRIEQAGAAAGDAFSVDDIALRRATREFGADAPGPLWTTMSGDLARISTYSAVDASGFPDDVTRYLDHLRVYLDGRGGAAGTQKLRAVIYTGINAQVLPVFLLRASQEVTIRSGTSARWVDFRFDTPVRLSGIDGASYQFGLQSGNSRNVARYASSPQPGALWWGPDTYTDGPNQFFGTADPNGNNSTFTTADNQISIQGITAQVGHANPASCF